MQEKGLLSGIRVLDAGSWIAGPVAATIMADLGAEVIKVEQPGTGEVYRGYSFSNPTAKERNIDYSYILDARGKKSLALNLKSPEGYAIFEELVKKSDVVLTNQPGKARRKLKLDYASVKAINPRIIYASLTPYGEEGPEADKKAFDGGSLYARSGLMDLLRGKDQPPRRSLPGQGDHFTAVSLFAGIILALWDRERTGKGRKVSTSLFHNGLWSNALSVQAGLCRLDYPSPSWSYDIKDSINKPLYKTSDGRWIMLDMVKEPQEVQNFFKILGIYEQVINDERFKTAEGYKEHAPYLIELIDQKISSMTLKELDEKCKELDVPMIWVRNVYDIEHDQQAIINNMLIPVDENEWGFKYVLNHPVQLEGVAPAKIKRPPKVGEHTEEILTGLLGFTKEKIQQLKESNII